MCDLLDFEMRLWKSITNRKSQVDVKRGIRCDGLTGFLHRVLKTDVWSDNAHFIFVQIRCGAAHLPCEGLFNLCLCLSDVTWSYAYFIEDILPNSRLIYQSFFALDSPCLNRMQLG